MDRTLTAALWGICVAALPFVLVYVMLTYVHGPFSLGPGSAIGLIAFIGMSAMVLWGSLLLAHDRDVH
jgi:hypothetical protein